MGRHVRTLAVWHDGAKNSYFPLHSFSNWVLSTITVLSPLSMTYHLFTLTPSIQHLHHSPHLWPSSLNHAVLSICGGGGSDLRDGTSWWPDQGGNLGSSGRLNEGYWRWEMVIKVLVKPGFVWVCLLWGHKPVCVWVVISTRYLQHLSVTGWGSRPTVCCKQWKGAGKWSVKHLCVSQDQVIGASWYDWGEKPCL